MGAFVGEPEPFDRLCRRVMHEVKLRTGLVRVSRWKLAEEPMQPEDGCIGDQHLTEQLESWSDGVGDRDLLERMREEVAQQRSECWCEPIVETGSGERLVGRSGVRALKSGNSAGFAVDGEAQDERPDERRDVDLPIALDDITLARDVFDKFGWKQGSEPPSYVVWGERLEHILSPRGLPR